MVDSVQAFWKQTETAAGKPYQQAPTFLFTGSVNTGCGNATSDVGPFYCSADVGEANDAADGLRTEENERGGDPGPQGQGGVIEDAAEHREPAVLVQRFRVLGDDGGRQREAGHPAGPHAPPQE
ncbi:neutral zinc metallopeptidase [Streptomyces sp. NPDC088254]|uniref:neutral zinc metallopeptidase n=1 Tax=Streptomyces sp. NPDC088254 TaxID=3365847 RepID=UPI0038052AB3